MLDSTSRKIQIFHVGRLYQVASQLLDAPLLLLPSFEYELGSQDLFMKLDLNLEVLEKCRTK